MTSQTPSRWEGLRRFRDGWLAGLPGVGANLTTALLLFLFSLAFAPVRQALFGVPSNDYPLRCFIDAVATVDDPDLRVEFYIANPTDEDWDAASLQRVLNAAFEGSGTKGRVGIPIKIPEGRGRIVDNPADRAEDEAFNLGKGELDLVENKDGAPSILVREIGGRSVLRRTIRIAGVSSGGGRTFPRSNRAIIPFEYSDYEANCFGR